MADPRFDDASTAEQAGRIADRQQAMIIDDDKDLMHCLQYAFESYGYEVACCVNGTEALLLSMTRGFDYIITDCCMPGMDGIELTRRLREQHPRAIIIGMSGEDRGMEFLRAGANDFLQKPFVPYQLAMMMDGGDLLG